MTVEMEFSKAQIEAKWEEFMKSRGGLPKDLIDLAGDIVSLRYNTTKENGEVELLSKPSILVKHDVYGDQPHSRVHVGKYGDSREEQFDIYYKPGMSVSIVEYMIGNPLENSTTLENEKFTDKSGTNPITLRPDQVHSIAKKLWQAYKVTQRWVRIDNLYAKQEEELFLQGK